jgi:hypothetical protein
MNKQITYPISPEYVKSWTIERAISELVANAYDEDPDFTFEYCSASKELVIEDNGPGIPESGMILGLSNKTDQQIGTHGEGKKIASLVLARSKQVKDVVFETVGYAFRPEITKASFLESNDSNPDAGIDVLAYNFLPSSRKKGTKITIKCSQKIADKVRERFLFLCDPDYQQPSGHGQLLEQSGGKLYIGGVFIQQNKEYNFSYNFSLSAGKHLQNRDRTEITGWRLDGLVRSVLGEITDPEIILEITRKILDGKLSRTEQRIEMTPTFRKTLFENRELLLGKGEFMYLDKFDNHIGMEQTLDLKDQGYTFLETPAGTERGVFNSIMQALGVKPVKKLIKQPSIKKKTDWIKTKDLTELQRENLEQSVRIVRGLWGQEAVDGYAAFERTYLTDVGENTARGFYQSSGKGKIGIQRNVLNTLEEAVEVMTHEAAHRLRHRTVGYDYQDRTRGFETQLHTMAAQAAMLLHKIDQVPEAKSIINSSTAGRYSRYSHLENPFNKTVKKFIKKQMTAKGIKTAKQLSQQTGVLYSGTTKVVSGKNSSKTDNLFAIADCLDIDRQLMIVLNRGSGMDYFRRKVNGTIANYTRNSELIDALSYLSKNDPNETVSGNATKLLRMVEDAGYSFNGESKCHNSLLQEIAECYLNQDVIQATQ